MIMKKNYKREKKNRKGGYVMDDFIARQLVQAIKQMTEELKKIKNELSHIKNK